MAHLSQFSYSGVAEIVTAIQDSASALIEVEQHPPLITMTQTPSVTNLPVEPPPTEIAIVIDDANQAEATATDNASSNTQNALF